VDWGAEKQLAAQSVQPAREPTPVVAYVLAGQGVHGFVSIKYVEAAQQLQLPERAAEKHPAAHPVLIPLVQE
jgi:hypothetical protein